LNNTKDGKNKTRISLDILVSIYSINEQMLSDYPTNTIYSWEYYVNLMMIFVDLIFIETPIDLKSKTFKYKNILYMAKRCSDEEKKKGGKKIIMIIFLKFC